MQKEAGAKVVVTEVITHGCPAYVSQDADGRQVEKKLENKSAELLGGSIQSAVQRIAPHGGQIPVEIVTVGEHVFKLAHRGLKAALNQKFGNIRPLLQNRKAVIPQR